MDSAKKEVSLELFPWLIVFKDGTLERIVGTEVSPAGFDPETQVLSKDIVVVPETGVTARIYRPDEVQPGKKLPLVVYFHGGAFLVASAADPMYHTSLNKLVAEAGVIAVSVNYRLAPENPLPAAYEDSWAALQWIRSHLTGSGGGDEAWIKDYVDFSQVFLVGDSAGANISHHLVFRVNGSCPIQDLKIQGIGMIHPYFWGTEPIGTEMADKARKGMVDGWWRFVCPSDKGSDDPWINPFADGSPDLKGFACERLMTIVAGKDILKERGKLYHETLVSSGWQGKAEFMETPGKDHVFHIFEPNSEEAKELIRRLALFVNQRKNPSLASMQ